MEEIELYLDDAKTSMDKAINHLAHELTKIRAGKATANMIDGLYVDYYGSQSPLSQVASVTTPDARTLLIKPWEKGMLHEIEKAIRNSNLGFNPQNDGECVRINVPMLTEERRRDLVKQTKNEGETSKVRIRTIRKDTNEDLKKLQKDGASEDAVKDAEAKVQKLTDAFIAKIEEMLAKKEVEIMTV
ncbi:MAG: ribosome recycling factor [Cytophagales bacterium]|jgi:ribosome recycling factor